MIGINESRNEFLAFCPYCHSKLKIKAGWRLKFRKYEFTPQNQPDKRLVFEKVPTWKCKICKQPFGVNTFTEQTFSLEDIPSVLNYSYEYKKLLAPSESEE